jgi:DNA-binding winged helix-turn-helix (wHTH) protein
MPGIEEQQPTFQFGVFEINPSARELRKHGVKLKLQDQPLQIPLLLLEHPGEIVTRERIQKRLWPENTYVDFDNAINSAVRKIRDALGDSPENPRFAETLARRGYRFIAPVSQSARNPSLREATPTARNHIVPVPISPTKPGMRQHRLWWIACASAVAFAAMVIGLRWWISGSNQASGDTPLPAVPLTSYPGFEQFPTFSPDGSRVAFPWDEPGKRPSNIYVIHDKFCQQKKILPARSEEREERKPRQSLIALYASRQGSCDTQNHPSICCLERRLSRGFRRRLSLCSLPVPKQVGGSPWSFRSVAQT